MKHITIIQLVWKGKKRTEASVQVIVNSQLIHKDMASYTLVGRASLTAKREGLKQALLKDKGLADWFRIWEATKAESLAMLEERPDEVSLFERFLLDTGGGVYCASFFVPNYHDL